MAQNRDLLLLAKKWEVIELPKEKKYLLKYFKTPLQTAFLKYVYVFGECVNFVDHTGNQCCARWLQTLYNRMQTLESLHRDAKVNMDMTLLAHIESGKYHLEIEK